MLFHYVIGTQMRTYSGGAGAMARKVVLVGNSGVGKTALVLRFCSDTWNDGAEIPSTIGGSYLAKSILVDDQPFTFQIWDTVGDCRDAQLA